MITGIIRALCIQAGTTDGWSLYLREALISLNTRMVRLHGFTPAELLLGFNPKVSRHSILDPVEPIDVPGWDLDHTPAEDLLSYLSKRDEAQVKATLARAEADSNAAVGKSSRGDFF